MQTFVLCMDNSAVVCWSFFEHKVVDLLLIFMLENHTSSISVFATRQAETAFVPDAFCRTMQVIWKCMEYIGVQRTKVSP